MHLQQIALDHVLRYALASQYAEGRILDAACGCGYGSTVLAQKGVVTGVDYSTDAIDWAEEYFPGPTYILGRIEDEPWEGKFETVVSLETIEHLKEPQGALKAFRRACTGHLIASVPNEELYPFKAESFAKDDSPHFRHYTPQEFEQFLSDGGFQVVQRYTQLGKTNAQDCVPILGSHGKFLIYVCK